MSTKRNRSHPVTPLERLIEQALMLPERIPHDFGLRQDACHCHWVTLTAYALREALPELERLIKQEPPQ